MAGTRRLYSDLAYLWPLVSPPEDYAEEAGHWRNAVRARLGEGRHRILELGVGGGHNLSHFTSDFEATAVDLSPEMLEHSRRLNPGVEHHVGDMRTVRLGKVFDAVLIHDAVSYMLTEDDLRAAFATAGAHLRPGGLLLVAPDLVAESFRDGKVLHWDIPPPSRPGAPEVKVEERLTDPDPTDTMIESWITYTITDGAGRRVETDLHVTGLFPLATWVSLMEEAGFETAILPLPGDGDGCGEHLFSGVLQERGIEETAFILSDPTARQAVELGRAAIGAGDVATQEEIEALRAQLRRGNPGRSDSLGLPV